MKELQFLLYNTPQENIKVDVVAKDGDIWLSQKGMSILFDVGVPAINKHLKNIFENGELIEEATISKMEIVQQEGSRNIEREVVFYNLDAIISVGYRVNSNKATQFRIWATQILKDFMQKGFVLDDERLKQGQSVFGEDYFQELLERVRSIRASERRIWLKITDIFAECSLDYDKNSSITREFYSTVQNKFHYAITGQTAPEIINSKADKNKKNMGLTNWKNAPDGRIVKKDVTVAKNYLLEKEIKQLERTVSSYFDYVEGLIERKNTFSMQDFAESINKFLTFNEYKILEEAGKISREQADKKAIDEYNDFNKTQKINSDFDKQIKKLVKPK